MVNTLSFGSTPGKVSQHIFCREWGWAHEQQTLRWGECREDGMIQPLYIFFFFPGFSVEKFRLFSIVGTVASSIFPSWGTVFSSWSFITAFCQQVRNRGPQFFRVAVGCLSLIQGNCVKNVEDTRELGEQVGEEWNTDGNLLIFNQFSPCSFPFNLQICRRHLRMLCRAALSPVVRSPGWCFVLPPHAIAAIPRSCMYDRKHTFLNVLVSACLGTPALFPMLNGKSPH